MTDALPDALAWLDERQAGVPETLRQVVGAAVKRVGDTQPTPEAVLRRAADSLLAESLRTGTATNPISLLAADALITYVCEYRSETEPDRLQALL